MAKNRGTEAITHLTTHCLLCYIKGEWVIFQQQFTVSCLQLERSVELPALRCIPVCAWQYSGGLYANILNRQRKSGREKNIYCISGGEQIYMHRVWRVRKMVKKMSV